MPLEEMISTNVGFACNFTKQSASQTEIIQIQLTSCYSTGVVNLQNYTIFNTIYINIITTILNFARLKPKLLLVHKSFREEQIKEKNGDVYGIYI